MNVGDSEGTASVEVGRGSLPLVGQVVDDRFLVLRHIGSGGMADVYEVEHVVLGRHLAMKVLRHSRSSSPQLARRFKREARAVSCLTSEHIVSIHEYGELADGTPYFVMDLLLGHNLRQELRDRGPLSAARATRMAIDVCLGLNVAHAAGLVHRDLKPENLWLSRGDDGRDHCILLDFGVARFEGTHTTGDGVVVGTARYMSPEQIAGEHAPDCRSDLFSLGVVLYECLSGVSPFAAPSFERTLFRVLNDAPLPLAGLADSLWPVVAKALAKRPEERFDDALQMADALRACAPSASVGAALDNDTVVDDIDSASVTPVAILKPRAYVGFAAGFALASGLGGALWLLRPPPVAPSGEPRRATPQPSAATTLPSAQATAALGEGRPEPVPKGSTSSMAAKRVNAPVRPAPTTRLPKSSPRPEPPRPDFDGRNPYLP